MLILENLRDGSDHVNCYQLKNLQLFCIRMQQWQAMELKFVSLFIFMFKLNKSI